MILGATILAGVELAGLALFPLILPNIKTPATEGGYYHGVKVLKKKLKKQFDYSIWRENEKGQKEFQDDKPPSFYKTAPIINPWPKFKRLKKEIIRPLSYFKKSLLPGLAGKVKVRIRGIKRFPLKP